MNIAFRILPFEHRVDIDLNYTEDEEEDGVIEYIEEEANTDESVNGSEGEWTWQTQQTIFIFLVSQSS